jgi:hypothetical protein
MSETVGPRGSTNNRSAIGQIADDRREHDATFSSTKNSRA